MKLTKHATIRSRQRGFSEEIIGLIRLIGDPSIMPGNVTRLSITKRTLQLIDKAKKKAILIDGNEIITVYNLR